MSFLQALKEKELGNAAYKNKDFDTALKHYEEAIKQDPINMTYISNQAGTYCHMLETIDLPPTIQKNTSFKNVLQVERKFTDTNKSKVLIVLAYC